MPLSEILNYLFGSTTILAIFIAWKTRKSEIKKIEALSSQEVSRSEQEKLKTADGAIELINKLRETMKEQYEEMKLEMVELKRENKQIKEELNLYKNQCSKCANNKIGRK